MRLDPAAASGERDRYTASVLADSDVGSGSEAVGRLEPISDQDTANFSEPNLKLNEIRQHGPTGAKPTSGQNQHRDICAREEVFPGESYHGISDAARVRLSRNDQIGIDFSAITQKRFNWVTRENL